jgi:hypothetical protein
MDLEDERVDDPKQKTRRGRSVVPLNRGYGLRRIPQAWGDERLAVEIHCFALDDISH